jgi:hypothetical protein
MKSPERITIALDEETAGLFKKMKDDLGLSQSELMREALKFYGKHRSLFDLSEDKKVYTHVEMLSAGEHIILDIDHWILFLTFLESHPNKEKFWELHKDVCLAHNPTRIRRSFGSFTRTCAWPMPSSSSTSSTMRRASCAVWRSATSSR